MSVPKMHSGGLGQYNAMLQAPLLESVLGILGVTGTVLPLYDPANAFTVSRLPRQTVHIPALDATYSEHPTLWDTPFNFNNPDCYQGIIPFLTFNGSDEGISYPDHAYWTHGDGSSADTAFSVGGWVNVSAVGTSFIAKYNSHPNAEYDIRLHTGNNLFCRLLDYSTGIYIGRTSSGAELTLNQWHFVTVTYSGNEANSGISLYIDAVAVDDADSENHPDWGSYAAMHNTTAIFTIGGREDAYQTTGKVAGGALGPIHTNIELSAAQVAHLYRLGRQALEL